MAAVTNIGVEHDPELGFALLNQAAEQQVVSAYVMLGSANMIPGFAFPKQDFGIMMLGAMTGFSTAYFTSSLWLGILAAMLTGMLMTALMGFLTVSLGLSQHVS